MEVEATLSKTRYISAMAESCINRGALPSRVKRSYSRRKKRSSDIVSGVLTQAAKSGTYFLLNSDKKREVVSKIVKTGPINCSKKSIDLKSIGTNTKESSCRRSRFI